MSTDDEETIALASVGGIFEEPTATKDDCPGDDDAVAPKVSRVDGVVSAVVQKDLSMVTDNEPLKPVSGTSQKRSRSKSPESFSKRLCLTPNRDADDDCRVPVNAFGLWVERVVQDLPSNSDIPSSPPSAKFAALAKEWLRLDDKIRKLWQEAAANKNALYIESKKAPGPDDDKIASSYSHIDVMTKLNPTTVNDFSLNMLVVELFKNMSVADLRRVSGFKLFQMIKAVYNRPAEAWSSINEKTKALYTKWSSVIRERSVRLRTSAEIREYNAGIPTFDDFRFPNADAAEPTDRPKFRLLSNGRVVGESKNEARPTPPSTSSLVCRILTAEEEALEFSKDENGVPSETGSTCLPSNCRFELVFGDTYDCLGFYDYSTFDHTAKSSFGPFFP